MRLRTIVAVLFAMWLGFVALTLVQHGAVGKLLHFDAAASGTATGAASVSAKDYILAKAKVRVMLARARSTWRMHSAC